MKKHLVRTFLFALANAIITSAQAQTLTQAQTASNAVLKVRQAAEQTFGAISSRDRDDDYDRDYCDCDKCGKQKKSKKHDGCNQRGNHYGKHKNKHSRHCCSCDHHECHNGRRRDRDDDDYRYGSNRRDRDDNGYRYGSNRRDRDDEYRQQPRPAQQKPTPKVKSRPAPTPKSTVKRPGTQRSGTSRPGSTRS